MEAAPMPDAAPARSCPDPLDRLVDAVVVGAGALGAATAWSLARSGRSVVLLDERTPRQVRLAARGTAWSAHPAWAPDAGPGVLAAWREVEHRTGATLLRRCDALDRGDVSPQDAGTRPDPAPHRSGAGPVRRRAGAAVQVRADHAIAALSAAAVGAGAVLRHRTPVTAVVVHDDERVEVRTPSGRLRAHRVVVTAVDPSAGPGLELHFTPRRSLGADAPLIAHHDPDLGLVRAVPCAQGHLAVGADTWPRGTLRDLRDHVRAWFPDVDAERPEPVGPDARSTASARVAVRRDGPVLTATSTALGSVTVVADGRALAEQVGAAAGAAESA
jgi:sarcosine oxidase